MPSAEDSQGSLEVWTKPRPPARPAARQPRSPRRQRRWARRLLGTTAVGLAAILGLWIAVHRIPWLGPLLANGLRRVVGVEAVARLEDFAYGLQDRWNRLWRSGQKPQAYWSVPAHRAEPPPPLVSNAEGCVVAGFQPTDVGPVNQSFSAPGDGSWLPVPDAQHPADAPRMFKTLLHPDERRSWSAVSVVAVDLRQVDLHLMAGWDEPKNGTREALKYERKAVIPSEAHGELLAAFNGGFRAEHGHYGMRIDGVLLVQPRRMACVLARYPDERVVIGDWDDLGDGAADALWWRQTPACMVEHGVLHPGLRGERSTFWGATLDGETIIRRSAVGLSADRKVLYVGIGDSTSAKAIAVGMSHAGAVDVAQLDVNWSYPRFVLYRPREPGSHELVATALCPGFEFGEDEYVRERADRDFFYLTRKSKERIAATACGDDAPGAVGHGEHGGP
jgi:hypothetical protein